MTTEKYKCLRTKAGSYLKISYCKPPYAKAYVMAEVGAIGEPVLYSETTGLEAMRSHAETYLGEPVEIVTVTLTH